MDIRLAVAGTAAAAVITVAARADVVADWNTIPPAELDQIWTDIRGTGGMAAIEPESHAIGGGAAQKKTWDFLNDVLKLYWGKSPIWFPVDLYRRTVCGPEARWSYFWWPGSGDERDLHPWLRTQAFEQLLGTRYGRAVVASEALDLSSCKEVQGTDEPCLYGEVTPPERFEDAFCGGRGLPCFFRLRRDATNVPPPFSQPATFCMLGPWVAERVHDWRPEIHPAEVIWSRPRADRDAWYVALVPDNSERFDAAKHFASLPPVQPKPWSRDRPVELWIAFSDGGAPGVVFDLDVEELRRNARPMGDTLTPPSAEGPFVALPTPRTGVLAAARTWAAAGGARRGLLVLRSDLRVRKETAVLMSLVARRSTDPRSPSPLPADRRAAARAGGLELPAPVPAVRLLPYTHVRKRGEVRYDAETVARFDPARPSYPTDEHATDRYNEALKGGRSDRIAAFGQDRPFALEWTLEAFRESDCTPVPVALGDPDRAGADLATVMVKPQTGKVTSGVVVRGAPPRPDARAVFKDVVTLGRLSLAVPPGVRVRGEGKVVYNAAAKPLPLSAAIRPLRFELPGRRYADEWALLRDVLDDVEPRLAQDRVDTLRKEACGTLGPACTTQAFSDLASRLVQDPATRWSTLRTLNSPDAAFARFARQLGTAFLWDGEIVYDEYARLFRFLAASYPPSPAKRTQPRQMRSCRHPPG